MFFLVPTARTLAVVVGLTAAALGVVALIPGLGLTDEETATDDQL